MNTEAKTLNKILTKQIQQHIRKDYTPLPHKIYSWHARLVQLMQINKCINHINGMKNTNRMTILIDAEKLLDKMQHSFIIKNPQQIGYKKNIP